LPEQEENVQETDDAAQQGQQEEQSAQSELDALKSQVAELKKLNDESIREAKAHQASSTRAHQELSRIKSQIDRSQSSSTTKQLLEIAEEQSGEENPKVKALKEQLAYEERLSRQEQVTQENKQKMEDKIKSAGLNPEDDEFDNVWDAFELAASLDGKFERAEKRLERVLGRKKPSETVKNEKQKQDSEEEIARKVMERKGLLVSDNGLPSGSGGSFNEVEQAFISGKISAEKYAESARKAGKSIF